MVTSTAVLLQFPQGEQKESLFEESGAGHDFYTQE